MVKKTILLIFVMYSATTAVLHAVHAITPSENIVPLFSDNLNATTTSTAVTDVEQALLDLINHADLSIDAALYEFNRGSIRDALISAHQRGVSIRIVTDDDVYANPEFLAIYQALETAGISVVDDGRSSLMHNKFFVIDEEIVWTGSMNMTDTGFSLNHNNSLVITSPTLAAIYQIEFEEMYVDGRFGTQKIDNVDHTLTIDDVPVEIYFSPSDQAMNQMIAEVNEASESIYFSIFFLTNNDLRDALIAKMNEGVPVFGVWDKMGASNFYSDDEALCDAGAHIMIEDFPGKAHHKFMVIDPGASDAVVITGSMNWSAAGDESNDENTLIIHDSEIAASYFEAYQALYQEMVYSSICNIEMNYLPLTLVSD